MITIRNVIDQKQESESHLIKSIRKKDFFELVFMNEIDMKRVSDKKKDQNEDFHKFNILVKQLITDKQYNLIEIATFLADDLFKEKIVIECFNEENYYNLRCEFSKKYNTEMEFNILEDFLY